jgi:hypothetical protein
MLPADPGLLSRFRAAGEKVAWRNAGPPVLSTSPLRARIAHLHDEEARVEDMEKGRRYTMVTDSGPVGALLLVLEIDRRGIPAWLMTHSAGDLAAFPQGAIEAGWGARRSPIGQNLPIPDLVGLARYALA